MRTWISILMITAGLSLLSGCENGGGLINGTELPNMELPDAQGKIINLSDLRGNLVLVDVWASWCKPCRKQNPNLVKVYNKFKNASFKNAKGFTVYAISLDSKKEAWLNAIQKDGLPWPYQVSELTGWQSKAVEAYKLSAIPSSFLIDENGMIIGKDLNDIDLSKILENRLAK